MDQRFSRLGLAIAAIAGLTAGGCGANEQGATASGVPTQQETPATSVEDEVLANIRTQNVASHTVGDFNIPEEFLRRLADRVIRNSFVERHRIVVRDNSSSPQAAQTSPHPDPSSVDKPPSFDVVDRPVDPAMLATRQRMSEGRPALRGFRASIRGDGPATWPLNEPHEPLLHAAATMVGRSLAHDGLLPTTARVIEQLGHDKFARQAEDGNALLKRVGIPVDWLAFFSDASTVDAQPIVQQIAERLARGESTASMEPWLKSLQFEFRPGHSQFRAATESGEHDVGLWRVQLSRGDAWLADGDGGNLDLVLQTTRAFPGAPVFASIERKHRASLEHTLARGSHAHPSPWRVIVEDLPVAQWTQDNGKAGVLVNHDGRAIAHATLVPRYASRGDDGSTFIPGETFLLQGLTAAGHTVIQSPLLFQGGNLLIVRHPRSGRRMLLLGDAEVHRNTALGLTAAQVVRAFQIEFSVEECLVLPLVSFHLDYDVTMRAVGDNLAAFVNDSAAAIQIVLECGLQPLIDAQVIDAGAAERARDHLKHRQWRECLNLIAGPVYARGGPAGQFPLSLADRFSTGPADSGVGNFQRFLQALDMAAALALNDNEMPPDRHVRSYLASFRRMAQQRQNLHAALRSAGFRLIEVPGLSDEGRAINYINGIHTTAAYLMPAYGGLYARLDDAAEAVFRAGMGPDVLIVRVRSAESQRRSGAVHCSVAAYPRLESAGLQD